MVLNQKIKRLVSLNYVHSIQSLGKNSLMRQQITATLAIALKLIDKYNESHFVQEACCLLSAAKIMTKIFY